MDKAQELASALQNSMLRGVEHLISVIDSHIEPRYTYTIENTGDGPLRFVALPPVRLHLKQDTSVHLGTGETVPILTAKEILDAIMAYEADTSAWKEVRTPLETLLGPRTRTRPPDHWSKPIIKAADQVKGLIEDLRELPPGVRGLLHRTCKDMKKASANTDDTKSYSVYTPFVALPRPLDAGESIQVTQPMTKQRYADTSIHPGLVHGNTASGTVQFILKGAKEHHHEVKLSGKADAQVRVESPVDIQATPVWPSSWKAEQLHVEDRYNPDSQTLVMPATKIQGIQKRERIQASEGEKPEPLRIRIAAAPISLMLVFLMYVWALSAPFFAGRMNLVQSIHTGWPVLVFSNVDAYVMAITIAIMVQVPFLIHFAKSTPNFHYIAGHLVMFLLIFASWMGVEAVAPQGWLAHVGVYMLEGLLAFANVGLIILAGWLLVKHRAMRP